MTERAGFELPLLLLGAFRALVDDLHSELAKHGHERSRPIHGFALQALGADGITISELGRRLGVSKQAAAKTAGSLEDAGYAARAPHPNDGRAWVLTRTPRGAELLVLSARILDDERCRWRDRIGGKRFLTLEDDLAVMATPSRLRSFSDLPGWLQ